MGTVDIIPDIHGQIAKLRGALDAFGWRRSPAGWIHADPERTIVFLGDFIDRGQENRAVIHLVRDLIDSGKARAIMGQPQAKCPSLPHGPPRDRPAPPRSFGEEPAPARKLPGGVPRRCRRDPRGAGVDAQPSSVSGS